MDSISTGHEQLEQDAATAASKMNNTTKVVPDRLEDNNMIPMLTLIISLLEKAGSGYRHRLFASRCTAQVKLINNMKGIDLLIAK